MLGWRPKLQQSRTVVKGAGFCYHIGMQMVMTGFAAGAIAVVLMVAAYVALDALVRHLRRLSAAAPRNLAALIALALAIVIADYVCGTKPETNGVPQRLLAPLRMSPSALDLGANESPAITSLVFSSIGLITNGVSLEAAWPLGFFPVGSRLDLFARTLLVTDDWDWVATHDVRACDTNTTFAVDLLSFYSLTSTPREVYFVVKNRETAALTMEDSDGDGFPDVYELNNGTNPYVPDAASMPRITVGAFGDYPDILSALSASTNYSVIALAPGFYELEAPVWMPHHPVMLMGDGEYAVVRSSACPAAFVLDAGQDGRTVFRNLYVALAASSGFQAAFWIGGGLPWSGTAGSATFVNVKVVMLYPGTRYFGWNFYRHSPCPARLCNCMVDARGADWGRGISACNPPRLRLVDVSFADFMPTGAVRSLDVRVGDSAFGPWTNVEVAVSGAGYRHPFAVPSLRDFDGDGIADIDEDTLYHTDMYLADSDGDLVADAAEITDGTDPMDVKSFSRDVLAVVEADGGCPVRTGWGVSSSEWGGHDVRPVATAPATNSYHLVAQGAPLYVQAYCDLDGDGVFDADADVMLSRQVLPSEADATCRFRFGDVDGDGIGDSQERLDGSDPYDPRSLRMSVTVVCLVDDPTEGVAGRIGWGYGREDALGAATTGLTNAVELVVDAVVTNDVICVAAYRDLDASGDYDPDADVLYVKELGKDANGRTVEWHIGDFDGDGVYDGEENREGTDFADRRRCCFNVSWVERGVPATSNVLTVAATLGPMALLGPQSVTGSVFAADLGHVVVTNGETLVWWFWDDANSNLVWDADELGVERWFAPNGHDNAVTNSFSFGPFDADGDGMLDHWELVHAAAGLSPTNAADAFVDFDGDGLVSLHEYWTGSDPGLPDGSNTLLSVCCRSVDERLSSNSVGKITKFASNGYGSVYNTNCWSYGICASCASPWNSRGGGYRTGTAVTKRHVVMADHYKLNVGDTIRFLGDDGVQITRFIIAVRQVAKLDISVGLLNDELPLSITPAKLWPQDSQGWIGSAVCIPCMTYDYDEKSLIFDVDVLSARNLAFSCKMPHDLTRRLYFETVESGDSGNPRFILIENEAVLVGMVHNLGMSRCGDGIPLFAVADSLQTVMNDLSDEWEVPRCQLEFFDVSRFPPLVNWSDRP